MCACTCESVVPLERVILCFMSHPILTLRELQTEWAEVELDSWRAHESLSSTAVSIHTQVVQCVHVQVMDLEAGIPHGIVVLRHIQVLSHTPDTHLHNQGIGLL